MSKGNQFSIIFVLVLSFTTASSIKENSIEEISLTSTNNTISAAETLPTQAPTTEPAQAIALMPVEPGTSERTLEDVDASIKASEKRTVTGDNILKNLYERPFTQETMDYQPDLNILTVSIAYDENFHYFTIVLDGVDPSSEKLNGAYGIEFDRTLTGRGDMLVWVSDIGAEWSSDNLLVYIDPEGKVGGIKPVMNETNYSGEGYSKTVELGGDQTAWARLDPENSAAVQIAVSRALLGDPEEFLWGAWADGGVQDPGLFDYNDHFSSSAAGSPINTDPDYPLKALYSLDNTCRLPYGFEQSGSLPGMCFSAEPTPVFQCRICYSYECEWVEGVFTCPSDCCDEIIYPPV